MNLASTGRVYVCVCAAASMLVTLCIDPSLTYMSLLWLGQFFFFLARKKKMVVRISLLLGSLLLLQLSGHANAFATTRPSSSSLLFGTTTQSLSSTLYQKRASLPVLTAGSSSGASEMVPSSSSGSKDKDARGALTSQLTTTSKNLFRVLDDFGQSMKPRALKHKETAEAETASVGRKIRFTVHSSIFFTLFILYRAYRGFFVILPAVFREVYRKLETAVDESPFVEDEAEAKSERLHPIRTTATVSVLAGVVTVSYALGGALRVLGRFGRTLTNTSNVPTSFEAAAEQIIMNEDKIQRLASPNMSSKDVNGNGQKKSRWSK